MGKAAEGRRASPKFSLDPSRHEGPQATGTTPGGLSNVPLLPPHFLPRPEQLQALKQAVLAQANTPVMITGTALVGLQGMGGIGKSVLAAALARDEQIRLAFPDGVLWVTLSQEPEITRWQSRLAEALGDGSRTFTDEEQGRSRLEGLLATKACLIILDDVWQTKHVGPFNALGPSCRMLITTRYTRLITDLGATEYSLDVLTDAQAVTLLASWAGQPAEAFPPEAHDVVSECGNLPLALAMIGALVRGKPGRWGNALDKLRQADLDSIRQEFPHYPYPTLLRAIQVSVEALQPSDQARYLDFAAFPEDTPIPEAVFETFWTPEGLKRYEAQDVVDRFVGRSLARRDDQGRLSLHDLQFDFVRNRAKRGDPAVLHNRLLSAYAQRCPAGWPSGPKDGYFFEHLAYHLIQARRRKDLRSLLLDCGWMQARLTATEIAGLLSDYEFLVEDADVRLVQGALRLSAHILAQDSAQLCSQLLGRLLFHPLIGIEVLLDQAKTQPAGPWLCPLTMSLAPPGGSLLRTLTGHRDWVRAVTITPDGRYAVSGSNDRTLKVWDLASSAERLSLKGHSGPLWAVAITPDGSYAVSGSVDDTLKVWDLASGAEHLSLKGHSGPVHAVAITPDGRYAVSGSADRTLKVWDLTSGVERLSLKGHGSRVYTVAVTPDGCCAVSGSGDDTLKVWDLTSGVERLSLKGHGGPVYTVAVTPDGRYAVSGSMDRTLKVWDLTSGAEHLSLLGHRSRVYAVAITPSGRYAVSASADGTLKVWDLASGAERFSLRGHGAPVTAVVVTPDDRCAISGSADRTLKVWHLASGAQRPSLKGHGGPVCAVAVTPDGHYAVSGSDDYTLKVWDLISGAERLSLQGHDGPVHTVAVTPDGRCAISGSADRTLKVWDLASGAERLSLRGHGHWIHAVAVTPDGRTAVSSSGDDTLKVWDLASGAERLSLPGHGDWVRAVAITPDGRYVVSGSVDGTLKVWHLTSGAERPFLSGHDDWVNAVAVTPDGRCTVSASSDCTLKIWDLASGVERVSLRGHGGRVYGVAITPDGRYAVSGSADGTLKVWDLATGVIVASFHGDSSFLSCASAPDGRTLVAGDAIGLVHFLRLKGV